MTRKLKSTESALKLDLAQLYEAFDSGPTQVVEFLEWVVARYRVGTPPAVLDVGCGSGRLFEPLTVLGWRVTGLEPDPVYRARAETVAEALGVTVLAGGFNDVEGSAEFDLILGINSSFAHLLSPPDRADALVRCRRALRDGGALVLDLPNILRILHEYRAPRDQEAQLDGRRIVLARTHSIDYREATFTTHDRYVITEPDGTAWSTGKEHPYCITAMPDLERLLNQAGFDRVDTFGSMAERMIGRVGARCVIVAAVT